MRVGERQSDEGRGWGLRKKKRGEGREAEGVETEHEEKKETGMRPNAGRHKCFRAGVENGPPVSLHSSRVRCAAFTGGREMCLSVGLNAGADSRQCF